MKKLVVRRQTSVSFATSNSLRSIVMDKTAPEDESQRTLFEAADKRAKALRTRCS
jgi:hypothetical protein